MSSRPRDDTMRVSGILTGASAIGALIAVDTGGPAALCWALLGVAFAALIVLALTTVRPHWSTELADHIHRINKLHSGHDRHGPATV